MGIGFKNYQQEYLLKREFFYLKDCKKILDIGCGEGEFMRLSPKKIIGIDSNKKSIQICRKNKLNVVLGEATKLPFANNFFDGVHCCHVIEHMYPSQAHKMLSEVSRVLKKNGIFLLSTPILWHGFYNDFTHIKPYNPESLIRYLCVEGKEKTLGEVGGRFELLDLYWRYRPVPMPTKAGRIISSFLYQYGLHGLRRDAYTLVLRKS